jgi:hypothetical protein
MTRLVCPAIDLAMHRGEDPLLVKQLSARAGRSGRRHRRPLPLRLAGDYGASHYAYQWAGVMTLTCSPVRRRGHPQPGHWLRLHRKGSWPTAPNAIPLPPARLSGHEVRRALLYRDGVVRAGCRISTGAVTSAADRASLSESRVVRHRTNRAPGTASIPPLATRSAPDRCHHRRGRTPRHANGSSRISGHERSGSRELHDIIAYSPA